MVKIDKDVPLTPIENKGGWGAKPKYPWRQMQIGDSFVLPKSMRNAVGLVSKSSSATGFKFTARAIDKQSVRVWRIA